MIYVAKSLRKLSISEQLDSLETEHRKDMYTLQNIIANYNAFFKNIATNNLQFEILICIYIKLTLKFTFIH